MKRKIEIEKLSSEKEWDFVIIGGGASGLGSALDAASRGFKTLLLESYDFSKGTSSRSTKLIHGGVRYMAQGHLDLVKEALKERGLLEKNASHIVSRQSFIIPNYTWWEGIYYKIGLTFYDLLAKNLSLGKTKYLSREEVLKRLPTLKSKKLSNGVSYIDGQFDDARLSVNLAQTIIEQGGGAINYMEVTNLEKERKKITGVTAKDKLSGKSYLIRAKVVINATGVFTNKILNMDSKNHGIFVVPSQGTHLVLDSSFLKSKDAIMIPKTTDGRVLFIIPWRNKALVGTTDTLVEHPNDEPRAKPEEIDFILNTSARYLTKKPTKADVLSVFAGLRPLAAPKNNATKTKEVSRSHKVIVSDSGLITITGGKWTTYRKMAEDTVNKAIKIHKLPKKECKTDNLSIHGSIKVPEVHKNNSLYFYGSDATFILELEKNNPGYAEKIHPRYDFTVAEIIWSVRNEMAETVEDILARRTRLLFLDAKAAIECASRVAEIMAKEKSYDENWVSKQTENFITLATGYLLT
ncbi:MAG: glycerol-3-phosphate dehydrogenase/oxidase [Bergeyella sp.]|nr:glycerol-3-phosphate dehydrogenase/oxidase [Bergeyella sp.]